MKRPDLIESELREPARKRVTWLTVYVFLALSVLALGLSVMDLFR